MPNVSNLVKTIQDIMRKDAGNFNSDTDVGDVDHLLPEYERLLTQIAKTHAQLKAQLMEALKR